LVFWQIFTDFRFGTFSTQSAKRRHRCPACVYKQLRAKADQRHCSKGLERRANSGVIWLEIWEIGRHHQIRVYSAIHSGFMGAVMRALLLVLAIATPICYFAQLNPPAMAQAGSTGGTVGKQDKSVSGGEEGPDARHTEKKSHRAVAPKVSAFKCPNLTGTWNTWAAGMFGKGDATFNSDGTAMHGSGIPGKWGCEDGHLFIRWAIDGRPGEVKLSRDGKKVTTPDGGVHMSRD
jgi:hypothetical protein